MPKQDRVDWTEECCAEQHILIGSEREAMCQSTLLPKLRAQVQKRDLLPPDMGLADFLGEDERFEWTKTGAKSELGKVAWAEAGDPVNDLWLRVQPLTVQEGQELGYWKVVPTPTSLFQARGPEHEKDCMKIHQQITACTQDTKGHYMKNCERAHGWKVRVDKSNKFARFSAEIKNVTDIAHCASRNAPVAFQWKGKGDQEQISCFELKNLEDGTVKTWLEKLKPLAELNLKVLFSDTAVYVRHS